MAKDVHIGKKIQGVLKERRYQKTEFADMINISRTVVYDIFKRETIDTGLLKKISEVLNHDFFSYYDKHAVQIKETESPYGYATKAELSEITSTLNELAKTIVTLSKEIESLQKKITVKKVKPKK